MLAVLREVPNLRAALEIKYRPALVSQIERMGLEPRSLEALFSEAAEPETLFAALGRTFRQSYSETEKLSVAYTEGGDSREGAIMLLGETAVSVARKAITIAEAYAAA